MWLLGQEGFVESLWLQWVPEMSQLNVGLHRKSYTFYTNLTCLILNLDLHGLQTFFLVESHPT